MNALVYKAHQNMLMNMASLILNLPLSEMLGAINRAETVGPILDPTLYMRGNGPMQAFKEIVEGAITFQSAARKHAKMFEPKGGDVE